MLLLLTGQALLLLVRPEESGWDKLKEDGKHGVEWLIKQALEEPAALRAKDPEWATWA